MVSFFDKINPFKFYLEIRKISFYQGVIKPFFAYYQITPDNDYWTKEKIIALKYRLVMLSCFLSIILSYYIIANKTSYASTINEGYNNLSLGINELKKDFPLRIYAYIHFFFSQEKNFKKENFEKAITSTSFVPSVTSLIKKDLQNGSAELGGIIFFKKESFNFVVLESSFLEVARDIQKSINNEDLLRVKFVQYREEIEKRFGENLAIKSINRWIEREPENIEAIKRYLQFSVFLSNYSYFLDEDTLMEEFYGNYRGSYIGNFHVHRYGDPVSDVDLESSFLEDKFVIISKNKNNFEFVWLRKGEIYIKSEYVFD